MMCLFHEKILILGIAFFGTPGIVAKDEIVTAQKQPQPQQQNNHNCSWVETK